jgi:hypothetical protein
MRSVTNAIRTRFLSGIILGAVLTCQVQAQGRTLRWYKGNTHTHTLNSDGDSPPDVVVRWYRENGWQFVVITDHEYITDVAPLNALFGAAGRFLVIRGQEVTQRIADSAHAEKWRQAHMNSINATRVVMPQPRATIAESYRQNIEAIRSAGGLPQINHPNWRWSVRLTDMLDLPDSTMFELWNGHPGINNLGGADGTGQKSPSTEALWDSLLTRGKLLWGAGTDDSHTYTRPWDRNVPRPGQAWVVVRADTLSPEAIVTSLRRGEFYASTGVQLRDYVVDARGLSLTIERVRGTSDDTRFRTEFIGRGGMVLATVEGMTARYDFRGNEGYVRARVTDSHGQHAWTQPVRPSNR